MPFFILGVVILLYGTIQFAKAKKNHFHEGETGSIGLILAGIILIVLYGIFYRILAVIVP